MKDTIKGILSELMFETALCNDANEINLDKYIQRINEAKK